MTILRPQVIKSLTQRKFDTTLTTKSPISQKKLMVGFWHNWPAEKSGYRQGTPAEMPLSAVPAEYNVIAVAFMKGAGIPTFTPYKGSDAEFREQIAIVHTQGRAVLLSLGGADAHIELKSGQEEALAYEIIRLVELYGFDGLDIDLEQAAILAADNPRVIPAALRLVKDYYQGMGLNFIISMAPEFPYLAVGGAYAEYIARLDGYYDFIAPQYYNQGGAGVWVDEINKWVAQNNDSLKEDFLFYLTDSLARGVRGYIKIPAEKLVIGLPSNNDAAANGYVIDPKSLQRAVARLSHSGHQIHGIMTWSVNWDMGRDSGGNYYGGEFAMRYGNLFQDEIGHTPTAPGIPQNVRILSSSQSSISIAWDRINEAVAYKIYRDDALCGTVDDNVQFQDSGLNSGAMYRYSVAAVNAAGSSSGLSTEIVGITDHDTLFEWVVRRWYEQNEQVLFGQHSYICLQQHTSIRWWAPNVARTLWALEA